MPAAGCWVGRPLSGSLSLPAWKWGSWQDKIVGGDWPSGLSGPFPVSLAGRARGCRPVPQEGRVPCQIPSANLGSLGEGGPWRILLRPPAVRRVVFRVCQPLQEGLQAHKPELLGPGVVSMVPGAVCSGIPRVPPGAQSARL